MSNVNIQILTLKPGSLIHEQRTSVIKKYNRVKFSSEVTRTGSERQIYCELSSLPKLSAPFNHYRLRITSHHIQM